MLDPLKKPCCAITLTDYSKPNEENKKLCQCFQPTSRFGWSATHLNKRKYYERPRVFGRVCGASLSPLAVTRRYWRTEERAWSKAVLPCPLFFFKEACYIYKVSGLHFMCLFPVYILGSIPQQSMTDHTVKHLYFVLVLHLMSYLN